MRLGRPGRSSHTINLAHILYLPPPDTRSSLRTIMNLTSSTPSQSDPESVPRSEEFPDTPVQARLAWMVCFNNTGSVQEVCRRFGISKKTFYKWLKRYKDANEDSSSLLDRSRRPHHCPRSTPIPVVALLRRIKNETGYGQRRLKAYLSEYHKISLSERTIWKILKRLESQQTFP